MNYTNLSKLCALGCAIVSLGLNSCSMVSSAIPVDKLPEPLRGQVVQIKKEQAVVHKHYTQGSAKMSEAYGTIAAACGNEKLASQLKSNARAISQASSSDADKQISKGESLKSKVRKTMKNSNASTVKSKTLFTKGLQQKDEAYMSLYKLGGKASVKAYKATGLIKNASPLQKVMLTASFDPLFHVARDIPATLKNEKQFNENLKDKGKTYSFPIPKRNLPTPKPANIPAY